MLSDLVATWTSWLEPIFCSTWKLLFHLLDSLLTLSQSRWIVVDRVVIIKVISCYCPLFSGIVGGGEMSKNNQPAQLWISPCYSFLIFSHIAPPPFPWIDQHPSIVWQRQWLCPWYVICQWYCPRWGNVEIQSTGTTLNFSLLLLSYFLTHCPSPFSLDRRTSWRSMAETVTVNLKMKRPLPVKSQPRPSPPRQTPRRVFRLAWQTGPSSSASFVSDSSPPRRS